MNAIITLNHFCDIHGPQVIFTTQTLRDQLLIDSKNDELKSSSNNDCKSPCGGCSSIGNKLIFRSEDKESSLLFVSSEKTLFGSDILSLLKSTALRSLSCEVSFYYHIDNFSFNLSEIPFSYFTDNIRKFSFLW
jgi:folliculin